MILDQSDPAFQKMHSKFDRPPNHRAYQVCPTLSSRPAGRPAIQDEERSKDASECAFNCLAVWIPLPALISKVYLNTPRANPPWSIMKRLRPPSVASSSRSDSWLLFRTLCQLLLHYSVSSHRAEASVRDDVPTRAFDKVTVVRLKFGRPRIPKNVRGSRGPAE
jgi:hypothetical protein